MAYTKTDKTEHSNDLTFDKAYYNIKGKPQEFYKSWHFHMNLDIQTYLETIQKKKQKK